MAFGGTIMGLAFGAAALAVTGMAGEAEAGRSEPVTESARECSYNIGSTFRINDHVRKGFGEDGCIYTITKDRTRATHNYNMRSERGRDMFYRQKDAARAAEERYEDLQDRRRGADAQRCANALGRILGGNGNPDSALQGILRNCL